MILVDQQIESILRELVDLPDYALVNPNSLDFRLGPEVFSVDHDPFKNEHKTWIDPLDINPKATRFYTLECPKGFILNSGKHVQVSSLEKFSLPSTLSAQVFGLESLDGLSLQISTKIIPPGYGRVVPRKLVIQLHNQGKYDISLTTGMRIGQVAFYQVAKPRQDQSQRGNKIGY